MADEDIRELNRQVGALRQQVGGLEVLAESGKEKRADISKMVMDIGAVMIRIESSLADALNDIKTQNEHIKDHCLELKSLKVHQATQGGMVRGAMLAGGLLATAIVSIVGGIWAVATHLGWIKGG